jgi:hypothetical protein
MTRICFDYDIIKYSAGFAAETRHIVATHKQTGESYKFENRTEFYGRDRKSGWLSEINEKRTSPYAVEEWEIEDVQTMRPFHTVRDIVNTSINSVCKQLGTKDYYGYLERGKNFRHAVATMQEYKGGRSSLKPLAIDLVEELLIDDHNGRFAPKGFESDDAVIMDSYVAWQDWVKTKHKNDRLIVVTKDKDARGCNQLHLFNPDRMRLPKTINGFGSLYWRDDTKNDKLDGHGRIWFYAQFGGLGDKIDTYSPTYLAKVKWGEVATYNMLKDCKDDRQALTAIVEQYKKWYPEPVTYLSWYGEEMTKDWLGIAEEIWTLARMKRWIGDNVTMKEVLDKLGVTY